jgi:uncharacterized membrane protein
VELLFLGLLLVCVPFVLPIIAWVSARTTRSRLEALRAIVEHQQRELDELNARLRKIASEAGAAPVAPAATLAPPPAAAPTRPAAPVPPVSPHPASPQPEPPPRPVAPAPTGPPGQTPVRPAPSSAPAPPPVPGPPPRTTPAPAQPSIVRPSPAPVAAAPAQPPAPPAPPRPPSPPEPAAPVDWERLVVKLASVVAGVALVIASVFFLRYSIEAGWLQPPVRVAIAIVVATALLVLCELKAARRYLVTANAMDAAAIAILFSTFFAAHALWNLIPAAAAFVLLALVTALAVLLSIRRESLFIAVLGLLGGFATPALLSTGENRPIPLFAYLLLLNVGLAWVAYSRGWPVLTWLTLVFTVVYQWGWVFKFLDASSLPLAMGVFIVFPLAAMVALILNSRGAGGRSQAHGQAFERSALVSAVVPLLFAVYLAAVPAYGRNAPLLFGFLLLVDAGLFAIAAARREWTLHGIGAVTTLIVMAVWLAVSYDAAGSPRLLLAFTSAFVVFYATAPLVAGRLGRTLDGAGARARYAAPWLLFVFPVLALVEPAFVEPWPLAATLAALLLTIAWRAARARAGWMYFIAAFFAIAMQAVWSAAHLTLERLGTAVAMYAMFGVISLAVPVVARSRSRPLTPAWGGGVVLLASLGLLLFLSAGAIAPAALWALALLLAIINAGLFIESAAGRLPLVSQIGSMASWVLLMVWWQEAAGSVGVLSSLTVVVGLALVTLIGHAWSLRSAGVQADGVARLRFAHGVHLGLIGHLFLALLASNRAWALPPWPLFAALGVMTLAASATALWGRTPSLHAAACVAAAVVVAVWNATAGTAAWGLIAGLAPAAVTGYALAWIAFGEALGNRRMAAGAACATIFAGELALIAAVEGGAMPPFPLLVAAHTANAIVVLVLAWRFRWHVLPLAAVMTAWFALAQWQTRTDLAQTWRQLLVLTGALYVVYVGYPFAIGRRIGASREPFLAAILASAVAFFAARAAFLAGGLESFLGIVPVLEGAVLALMLRALLRLEPAEQRDTGRLALVAGAALAFVTVAIPVQLRHQWITIGWALEGAALAWLYRRVPHKGLLYTAVALLGTVFVRLAMNPDVLVYEPRGVTRIFNWYLYTYLICAAALFIAAWWLSKTEDSVVGNIRSSALMQVAGTILLFLLLNIEIADYYAVGPAIAFRFGVTVSQDLTYTIGWLLFGLTMLGAGIYLDNRPARIAAVALIAVTTSKCFLYDLSSLGGLYRVGSLVGLAISLALVALALQRFVLSKPRSAS